MLVNKKKRYYSVSEALNLFLARYNQAKKLLEVTGIRSSDICLKIKKALSFCNSLEIVFIQYNLTRDCLTLVKIAEDCDELICKHGTVFDKLWQPRVLSFCISALLYQKLEMQEESLKYLYSGQQIFQNIKDAGGIPDYDISIPLNLLTFLVLWRLGRVRHANDYLLIADKHLRQIISSSKQYKLTDSNLENIISIISVCKASVLYQQENNLQKVAVLLENTLPQISENNTVSRKLIKRLLKKIYSQAVKEDSFFSNLDSEHSDDKDLDLDQECDIFHQAMLSAEFENILYVSCFVAHISEDTPRIRINELEKKKSNLKTHDYVESSYPDDFLGPNQNPKTIGRNYNKFLNSLLSKYNSKFIKDTSYRNHGVILQPHSPLRKYKKKNAEMNLINRSTAREFRSEPRRPDHASNSSRQVEYLPLQSRVNQMERRKYDFESDYLTQRYIPRMEHKLDLQLLPLSKIKTKTKISSM